MEGPEENRAAVTSQPGWDEWLLELLLDGAPCNRPSAEEPPSPSPPHSPSPTASLASSHDSPFASPDPGPGTPMVGSKRSRWRWHTNEARLVRDLLKALHGHCLKHEPRGWTQLERTACRLRWANGPTCTTGVRLKALTGCNSFSRSRLACSIAAISSPDCHMCLCDCCMWNV